MIATLVQNRDDFQLYTQAIARYCSYLHVDVAHENNVEQVAVVVI